MDTNAIEPLCLRECLELIDELGGNARFCSSSGFETWFQGETEPMASGFTPLTDFDIDTGVIGSSADGRVAFAFWRGEDS